MKITAAITTYDRPDQARRAVRSVLAQTLPPHEILVVEDGSHTGLEEWLEELGAGIRYLNPGTNRGLAASRNLAIREAEGSWIAFLDDDDEWMEQRLEVQRKAWDTMETRQRENLACLQVGIATMGPDGKRVSDYLPVNEGNLKESLMDKGPVTPSSAFLFRREALVEVGGFDEELLSGIDHDIWMKLAVAGWHNRAIPRALVRLHPDPIPSMLTNTEKRIRGISQFTDKWTPVWIEWFGHEDGRKYALSYFAMVISRLAGEKMAAGRWEECRAALRAIYRRAGLDLKIWAPVALTMARPVLKRMLGPVYRLVKRSAD